MKIKKIKLSAIARWGAPWRIGIFLLILLLVWLPVVLPYYLITGQSPNVVCLVVLYVEFFILSRIWGRRIHRLTNPLPQYGLVWASEVGLDLLKAMMIGLVGVVSLYCIQAVLGWIALQPPAPNFLFILLEGLLVALAVGLAEEFFFRGWLLFELERDYSPGLALWINGLLFAVAHFIRPISVIIRTWPQFLGLLLLGLALVWARRAPSYYPGRKETGKLGLPIGLHAGLVWGYYIFKVGELTDYSQHAPEWLTGIDQNPLAGVLGLVLLSLIAMFFQRTARLSTPL